MLHILRCITMHPDIKEPFSHEDSDEVIQTIVICGALATYESI